MPVIIPSVLLLINNRRAKKVTATTTNDSNLAAATTTATAAAVHKKQGVARVAIFLLAPCGLVVNKKKQSYSNNKQRGLRCCRAAVCKQVLAVLYLHPYPSRQIRGWGPKRTLFCYPLSTGERRAERKGCLGGGAAMSNFMPPKQQQAGGAVGAAMPAVGLQAAEVRRSSKASLCVCVCLSLPGRAHKVPWAMKISAWRLTGGWIFFLCCVRGFLFFEILRIVLTCFSYD